MSVFMEETAITLPAVEGAGAFIGRLWDCHSSTFRAENIFTNLDFTTKHLEACPASNSDYSLHSIKTTEDKNNAFHVSAEISLDLMSGMLKIAGGASFDKSTTDEFNSEHVLCVYEMSTFNIRARPGIIELLDAEKKQRIIAGRLQATHYVAGIQLGGRATADMTIRRKLDDSLFSLSAFLEGAMVITPLPITIGIKVGIGWLDNAGSSRYSKTFSLNSAPALRGPIPNSVEEMFARVEGIVPEIKKCKFPPFDPSLVYGVAIAFTLRPLAELFDTMQSPVYKQMENDLRQTFVEMLLALSDYAGPKFVTSKLYNMYNPIAILLSETPSATLKPQKQKALGPHGLPGEAASRNSSLRMKAPSAPKNPLVKEILNYEAILASEASSLRKTCLSTMAMYKKGDATSGDLVALLQTYNASPQLSRPAIDAELRAFLRRARQLLHAVHAHNMEGDLRAIALLKTVQQVDEWLDGGLYTVRLLLTTASASESEPAFPSTTFALLFSLSKASIPGLEIAIAFPNVSTDSCLRLKHEVTAPVRYNKVQDVEFALQLLLAMSKCQTIKMPNMQDDMPTRTNFYRVFSQFRQPELQLDLAAFHLSYFRPLRDLGLADVLVCESFVQLLDALSVAEQRDEWSLVLPMQAIGTAYDQIGVYLRTRQFLNGQESFPHKWVVARLPAAPASSEPAPLLLVFRGRILAAVCMDNLDIAILHREISGDRNFEVLGHRKLAEHCLQHMHGTNALHMIEHLASEWKTNMFSAIPCPPSFPPPTPDSPLQGFLNDARHVANVLALNEPLNLLTYLTNVLLNESVMLRPLLLKYSHGKWTPEHGWIEYMNQAVQWTEFEIQLKGLEAQFVSESSQLAFHCFINAGKAVGDWIERGERETETPDAAFAEICWLYLARLDGLVPGHLMNEMKMALKQTHPAYFKVCSVLTRVEYNPLLVTLQERVENTVVHAAIEGSGERWDKGGLLVNLISWMHAHQYGVLHYKDLWPNPKWRYWLKRGCNSSALLQTLLRYYCTNKTLPSYLPEWANAKLAAELVSDDGELKIRAVVSEVGTQAWSGVHDMLAAFKRMVTKQQVPSNLSLLVQQSVQMNEKLKTTMVKCGGLRYWNEGEGMLDEPWDLHTVTRAVHLLSDKKLENPTASTLVWKVNENKMASPPRDVVIVDTRAFPHWGRITDGTLPYTSTTNQVLAKFLRCDANGLCKPKLSQGVMTRILPWVLQQLLFNQWHALREDQLQQHVRTPPRQNPTDCPPSDQDLLALFDLDEAESNTVEASRAGAHGIGRAEIWTALLCSVEPRLLRTILAQLYDAGCVALPFLCPNIEEGLPNLNFKYKLCALPLYSSPSAGHMQERVIVCLRHYDKHKKVRIGKSDILNQHVASEGVFSNSGKKAYHPSNKLLPFVEFSTLNIPNANPEFWSRIAPFVCGDQRVVLFNVHGNVLDAPEDDPQPWQTLFSLCSPSFMVFWAVDKFADLKQGHDLLLRRLKQHAPGGKIGRSQICHLFLDPAPGLLRNMLDPHQIIETAHLADQETTSVVHSAFREQLCTAQVTSESILNANLPRGDGNAEVLRLPSPLSSAQKLLAFIQSHSAFLRLNQRLSAFPPQSVSMADNNDNMLKELRTLVVQFIEDAKTENGLYQVQWLASNLCASPKLDLHALLSPFSDDDNVCNVFLDYLKQGNAADFQVSATMTIAMQSHFRNCWGGELLSNCFSLFDANTNILVVSCIGETAIQSVAFPHDSQSLPSIVLQQSTVRLRCYDLRSTDINSAGAPSSCGFNVLLVLEWNGVAASTVEQTTVVDTHAILTLLVGISHCTILSDLRNPEETIALIEIPLATLPHVMPPSETKGTAMLPRIMLLSQKLEACNLNVGMQSLLDRLQAATHSRPQAHCNTFGDIQDSIYQNTLLQNVSTEGAYTPARIHDLITRASSGKGTRELSVPAWNEYACKVWANILKETNASESTIQYATLAEYDSHILTQTEMDELRDSVDAVYSHHEQIILQSVREQVFVFETSTGAGGLQPVLDQVNADLSRTLVHCVCGFNGAPCSACATFVEKQEHIMQHGDGQDANAMHIAESIKAYTNLVQDSLWTRIMQECRARELQHGKSAHMDAIIRTAWHSDEATAWTQFRQLVATYNGLPSPQRCIQQELESLRREIPSVPWVLAQLANRSTTSLPSLSEIVELRFESGDNGMGYMISECPSPLTHVNSALNWQQVKWLEEEIQNLNMNAMEHVWHSNFYHHGMVRQLTWRLQTQIIGPFEAKWSLRISTHGQWALHLWQCMHLQKLLQIHYENWMDQNDVLLQLQRRKEVFPNLFSEVKLAVGKPQ